MTKEKKELLTKDVCSRIPYHLKVNYAGKVYDVVGCTNNKLIIVLPFMSNLEGHPIEFCKPYLRPMSSMTKEEIEMYFRFRIPDTIDVVNPHHCCGNSICAIVNGVYMRYWYDDMVSLNTIDYLNSIHIDYRGLIDKGLSLPAPEGMYN